MKEVCLPHGPASVRHVHAKEAGREGARGPLTRCCWRSGARRWHLHNRVSVVSALGGGRAGRRGHRAESVVLEARRKAEDGRWGPSRREARGPAKKRRHSSSGVGPQRWRVLEPEFRGQWGGTERGGGGVQRARVRGTGGVAVRGGQPSTPARTPWKTSCPRLQSPQADAERTAATTPRPPPRGLVSRTRPATVHAVHADKSARRMGAPSLLGGWFQKGAHGGGCGTTWGGPSNLQAAGEGGQPLPREPPAAPRLPCSVLGRPGVTWSPRLPVPIQPWLVRGSSSHNQSPCTSRPAHLLPGPSPTA